MKRRSFLAGAAGISAALGLSACGGETEQGATTLDEKTEAKLTLFYWDKAQTPTVEANIKAFNEKYPKITVTPSIAVYKEYWTKLRTQAEGDQLPDVFWMNGPNIRLYASNGMLASLDDMQGITWTDYPEALVKLYTVDGKHYGVPKDFDTIACFINKKIFEQAKVAIPTGEWTWADHRAAAKAIADSKIAHGAVIDVGASNQSSYYNSIAQAGGFIIDGKKSGYDDPKTIAGLQYLADMIAEGSTPSLQVMSDTKPDQLFKNGQAGILWGGSWLVKPIREEMAGAAENVVVVPLPKGEKAGTIIHGLSYVANAKSPNLAAAKELVRFMSDKAAAEREAKNGTAIPAYNDTQGPWLEQAPSWNLKVFTEGAKSYSVAYPVSKNTSAWAEKEAEILSPAFSGTVPMEQAAKKMAEQMNELLSKE